MPYLKSSDPDYDAEEIEMSFIALDAANLDPSDVEAHFEHGQWWISVADGRQFSVCDAVGPPDRVCGGLSFEPLA